MMRQNAGEREIARRGFTREELEDARGAKARDKALCKVVKPEEMPWNKRGRAHKTLVNEKMDVRVKTMDIYNPGTSSRRALGQAQPYGREICLYPGGERLRYPLDLEPDIREQYYWKVSEEGSI